MARRLAQLAAGSVGSVAWVRDDLRDLAPPPAGEWMPLAEFDAPVSGDIFSPVCPIRFAPAWDAERYATQQQDPDTGTWSWLYSTQGLAVHHAGVHWLNTVSTGMPNVWPPGVAGWRAYEADGEGRAIWVQPTGAHDAYPVGFGPVAHAGRLWVSTTPANVWEPGVFGWTEVV